MSDALSDISQLLNRNTTDPLLLRILDCWEDAYASPKDLAALVRHWMRRQTINNELQSLASLDPELVAKIQEVLTDFDLQENQMVDGSLAFTTSPWNPKWVIGSNRHAVDNCSGEQPRRSTPSIDSDDRFRNLTGYKKFKSNGQFAAIQCVRAMREGSTTIVMLPTGSGKTEVALSLIEDLGIGHPMHDKYSLISVIIVPYISLAKDLERRFVDLYKDKWNGVTPLKFCYTHDTAEGDKEALIERINTPTDEIPGILITSPESFVGKFRKHLQDWAQSGRLGSIIFDEAHLIYQSGVGFRLDFRELSTRRDELIKMSKEGCRPRTLLMSATIGETELRYLLEKFGPVDNIAVVDATESRQEPDMFIASSASIVSKESKLREALHNLPRPLIIYVTKPDMAKKVHKEIREWGFSRTRCVVGETSSGDREEVLRSLRTGDGGSRCDIVVANSAFGLGIDCEEIRSVVHYCLPESVDRWYQEVGRGGRDGNSSIGLLITSGQNGDHTDLRVAEGNLPKSLLYPTFEIRWKKLLELQIKSTSRNGYLLDLRTPPGATVSSNWTENNGFKTYDMKWNRTVVYAMEHFGYITLSQLEAEEWAQIKKNGSTHYDWVAINPKRGLGIDMDTSFPAKWNLFREKLSKPFDDQLDRMNKISLGQLSPCTGIHATYAMPDDLIDILKPSLKFDRCNDQCGHCSQCFVDNIRGVQRIDEMPKMSVVQGDQENQLRTFVDLMKKFWSTVPYWRDLVHHEVNVVPVWLGDLSKEEIGGLELFILRYGGWIYSDIGPLKPNKLFKEMNSEVPSTGFCSSTLLDSSELMVYYRKHCYRRDLGVPVLILGLHSHDTLPTIKLKIDKDLEWPIAETSRWRTTTVNIVRSFLTENGRS